MGMGCGRGPARWSVDFPALSSRPAVDLTAARGLASVKAHRIRPDPRARARMNGIIAYGSYLPDHRLERKAIAEALGTVRGCQARAASPPTTRMRRRWPSRLRGSALRGTLGIRRPPSISRRPISAVSRQDQCHGDPRGARARLKRGGIRHAWIGSLGGRAPCERRSTPAGRRWPRSPTFRTGLPGGADEREGGDGAVAFLCAAEGAGGPVLATPIAWASATARVPRALAPAW